MPETRKNPLIPLTRPQAGRLRVAAALSVLAALVWLPMAALLALALDAMLRGQAAADWPLSPLTCAGLLLALGLARAGLNLLAEGVGFRAADALIAGLRARLARGFATATGPVSGAGASVALAGQKLALLAPYVTRYAPAQARVAVVPVLIAAVAAFIGWVPLLVLVLAGPLIPVFMALIGMAAEHASARQLDRMGSLNALLADRLGALTDMRLLGAEGRLERDFAARSDDLRARSMAVLRIAFLSSTVLELFSALGVAMMAVWCGFSVLGQISFGTWGAPLTPFQAIFVLLLVPEFFRPLRDLSAAWHDRASARALAAELTTALAPASTPLPPLAPALPQGTAPLPRPAAIATRGLRHHGLALPDLDLAPGDAVALVAPSGGGKTTLLHLLAGLETPDTGQVLIGGQVLGPGNADSWRARLGWMPQQVHFLDASLRANLLAEGRDPADALALAQADAVVAALPDGRATRLGETGAGLSGGEARRITLARAVLAGPDWLLADEPTADLDADSARAVTRGLLALKARGTGLIVATHDPRLAAALGRQVEVSA